MELAGAQRGRAVLEMQLGHVQADRASKFGSVVEFETFHRECGRKQTDVDRADLGLQARPRPQPVDQHFLGDRIRQKNGRHQSDHAQDDQAQDESESPAEQTPHNRVSKEYLPAGLPGIRPDPPRQSRDNVPETWAAIGCRRSPTTSPPPPPRRRKPGRNRARFGAADPPNAPPREPARIPRPNVAPAIVNPPAFPRKKPASP